MKRLAFVVQRYGQDVNGGAEELCRQVAERLSPGLSIEILTTTARDYLTWANHFPRGVEELNGVDVRRFPTVRQRRVRAFGRFSRKLYGRPHTFAQEAEWMDMQGPDVPELYSYIRGHRDEYDLFVFFTYLYPPTFFGLPLVAEKSLLAPMAHDEPPIRLDIFRPLFHLPRGLIFNTDEERKFVHSFFRNGYLPWTIGGAGIDIPPPPDDEAPDDYILYLGRVDVEKGCGEMLDFFRRHKSRRPSGMRLILAGDVKMAVPAGEDVVALGFVDAARKESLLRKARALVVPSRHESLSLVALEAWAAGTPVVAHRGSPVLVDHVERSGGGWLYDTSDEFSRLLDVDLNSLDQRRHRGQSGREYVSREYGWDRVLKSYTGFFEKTARLVRDSGADRD